MKILVTGAAGAIGSHVAEAFARDGYRVIGVDCLTDYYPSELKVLNAGAARSAGVQMYRYDLAEDNLFELVECCDAIFHFAAQPGISDKVSFETYVRNNITATQRLLDAAYRGRFDGHFFFISTSSVYGKRADVDEMTEPKPTSFYGVTKLAAEQLSLSYCRDKGLPVSVLRLFSVYGERERPDKLYSKLIRYIFDDEYFPLHAGSEKHVRSYTHVSDIVEACRLALAKRDEIKGEIFNIGNDRTITTGEGIAIVETIIGKKAKIAPKPARAGDQEMTSAKIEKAARILGYRPKVLPEEGLRRQVEWYRNRFVS